MAFCVMEELNALIYDPLEQDVTRAKQALKSSLLLHSAGRYKLKPVLHAP